jgi:protocatechuate 3,4-dioxygenase beta subunit
MVQHLKFGTRHLTIFALVFLLGTVSFAQDSRKGQSGTRMLSGQVMGNGDAPLNKAIVYLKNTKTLAMRTFITNTDGNYRFPSLSPNIDYEVYAESNGKRSDTKVLSSLDSRPNPRINLRISQ